MGLPVLKQGPFGLDLEKTVLHIITIFKGISIGVVISTLLAIIIFEINLTNDDISDSEATSLKNKIVVTICVCAFTLAYFFLCSYLKKGVEERDRTWIFPWFLVTGFLGLILIIVFFVSLSHGFQMVQIVLPFVIVFIYYCVFVAYSFYVDLGVNFIPEPTPTPTQVVPS